jgi:hypothetical protein
MGSGEDSPAEAGNDPPEVAAPEEGARVERTCITRIGALRPIGLNRLVELGDGTADAVLTRTIGISHTVLRHTHQAASEAGRRLGI